MVSIEKSFFFRLLSLLQPHSILKILSDMTCTNRACLKLVIKHTEICWNLNTIDSNYAIKCCHIVCITSNGARTFIVGVCVLMVLLLLIVNWHSLCDLPFAICFKWTRYKWDPFSLRETEREKTYFRLILHSVLSVIHDIHILCEAFALIFQKI